MNDITLKNFYEEAVPLFPVAEMQSTGKERGSLKGSSYAQEFTFIAGELLGKPLRASGWLNMESDPEGRVRINFVIKAIHSTKWKDKTVEQEIPLKAFYHLKNRAWNFSLLQTNKPGMGQPSRDTLEQLLEAIVTKRQGVQSQSPFPIREIEMLLSATLTKLENNIAQLVGKVLEKVPKR